MGKCSECAHYEYKGYNYKLERYERNWCNTFRMNVDPNATCNKFLLKDTPSNSGYTGGGSSGCFLTSACVEYMGKADGCEELTVLRAFRDNYVKKTADGGELVKQYYEIAPEIVEKIDGSQKREYFYKYIYGVVTACVKFIKENKYKEALSEYKKMVVKFKEELL